MQFVVYEDMPHLMFNSNGECFSKKVNRLLKMQVIGKGNGKYVSVGYRDIFGKSKHIKLHRIIAHIFIPNPLNKPYVNHIDGNKLNNKVSNLEWCSAKENCQHAVDNGLNPKIGEMNHNSKISNSDVEKIKYAFSIGYKQHEIAKDFNIHQSTVSKIVTNKTYTKI